MTRRVAQDIPVGLDFRAAGTSLTAAKDRLNGVAEVDAGVAREMTPAPLLIDMIVRNRCDVCKGWICQEPRAPKSRKVESPHPADDRTNENRDKSAKHPTSSLQARLGITTLYKRGDYEYAKSYWLASSRSALFLSIRKRTLIAQYPYFWASSIQAISSRTRPGSTQYGLARTWQNINPGALRMYVAQWKPSIPS
jgi:hypothetical protein